MSNFEGKKIAIVHDFLVQRGGAERVLECISEMFPEAPIYTLLYDEEKMRGMLDGRVIKPSFLQKFPKFLRKRYQWLLPFLLVVPETFDFRDFDLVISSSGAWSKGIVTKLNTKHVAYIHSPMRFVWDYNERYLKEKGIKASIFKRMVFSYLRIWDYLAAQRPEYLLANSSYTQKRISKYYRRESLVIYPPVDVESFSSDKLLDNNDKEISRAKDYFLVVSRLSGYKKVDAVIEAFNKLGLPLVVVGEGEHEDKLRKMAADNIELKGWADDRHLGEYYANARAVVFAAEEDFGMVPVEAMRFGVPIIAFRKGGLLEIVDEGKTGEFFDAQTPEVISDGIRRFIGNEALYDKTEIKKKSERFSKDVFKREVMEFLEKIYSDK